MNFAVAETGTLCLVENEGNGRMCTTVPDMHIAITGIEKVVEKLSDVIPLYSILPRSATGQAITTYFNMISRPRQPGEKDGPREVHLVLLDNGRSQAYADEQLRKTLQCIRCGAVHEPLPGVQPHWRPRLRHGLPGPDWQDHLAAYAWPERHPGFAHRLQFVRGLRRKCPVRIPIPEMLMRLREEARATRKKSPASAGWSGRGVRIRRNWRGCGRCGARCTAARRCTAPSAGWPPACACSPRAANWVGRFTARR